MSRHRSPREKLAIIAAAMEYPAGSRERGQEIKRIVEASSSFGDPITEQSIRRWIAAAQAGRLVRPKRADDGHERTKVGRKFDPIFRAHAGDAALDELRRKLQYYVRRQWRSGSPSWRQLQPYANRELRKLTLQAGMDIPRAELERLCEVPRQFIEREQGWRVVHEYEHDAKGFYDRHQYSVTRVRPDSPMDIVEGDVHPLDILVTREDGTVATPRLIAWHDVATARIFYDVLLLPKGRGVRRADVAESFIRMASHPHWGLPRTLYIDNGGEYGWSEFVDDAMRLSDQFGLYGERANLTVKARPYNARAKRIEGVFSNLERNVLRALPGWIGGDRMRKKTANVGHEPVSFKGEWTAFERALATALESYDTSPQSGLNNLSPRQMFAAAVEAGWQRSDIDAAALEWCFATEEQRTIKQGAFRLGGERYVHDELLRRPGMTKIRVRIPLVGARDRIPVLDDKGFVMCIAERAPKYAYLDGAGAREQARGATIQRQAIADMRRQVPRLDMLAEMGALNREAMPAQTPESAGTIRLSDEIENVAAATKKLGEPKTRTALQEQQERLNRFNNLLADGGAAKRRAGS